LKQNILLNNFGGTVPSVTYRYWGNYEDVIWYCTSFCSLNLELSVACNSHRPQFQVGLREMVLSFRIAIEFISKKRESLKRSTTTENEVKSLLELYLSSKELDMKDVTGMAVDMLLAGVDTVRS
jgi:hypothetical protein